MMKNCIWASRREERALIDWYADIVAEGLRLLDARNADQVLALFSLPDDIRGYEQVKSQSVVSAKAQAAALMVRLARPPSIPIVSLPIAA